MTKIEKVLYTGKTHTSSGGRNGTARSSDGRLDIKLSSPGTGTGTNPEQLFGAGWSAWKSTWARRATATSCRPASTSACPAWIAKSRRPWWMPRTRPAPIPKPRAGISTSRSTSCSRIHLN